MLYLHLEKLPCEHYNQYSEAKRRAQHAFSLKGGLEWLGNKNKQEGESCQIIFQQISFFQYHALKATRKCYANVSGTGKPIIGR